MPLEEYRRKRDFTRTPEPSGAESDRAATAGLLFPGWTHLSEGRRFCVQMHHASRLHWDFRLEHRGVLLSWAVPKGPTLDPGEKRLAVHVEDHPIDYGDFEGVIPDGYGAGTVMLWDAGEVTWIKESADDVDGSIRRGDLKFRLEGVKLRGEFALVRLGARGRPPAGGRPPDDDRNWLLLKKRDAAVIPGMEAADLDVSVLSGRSLAEIAANPRAQWHGAPPESPPGTRAAATNGTDAAARRDGRPASARALLEAAPRRRIPMSLEPMLALALDRAFTRDGWLFEVKYDGVRALATLRGGTVHLRGRRGRDETRRYPELAEIARAVAAEEAVLDGEIVALTADGVPSFELLQRRMNVDDRRQVGRLVAEVPAVYVAFDLLGADGHDVRDLPLVERKRILRDLLHDTPSVRYADHVERDGEAFFAAVAERGLEGMVAKRAQSRYEAGRRSGAWTKVRAWRTQDCVICGIAAGRNSRGDIGSLVLGVCEDGRLRYCGRVGSGLDESTMTVLRERLRPLRTDVCPFDEAPHSDTAVSWVEPRLVCSVRYSEWTREGTLRQPTWRGLRDGLTPADAVPERDDAHASEILGREPAAAVARTSHARSSRAAGSGVAPAAAAGAASATALLDIPRPDLDRHADELAVLATLPADAHWEIAGRRVRLTNLDKPLWTAPRFTKRDMLAYYVRVADAILPHLRDRPVGMQVFPDGIDGKHFWRKRIPDHAPEWIRTWTYHGDRTVTYVVVDDVATLAWMANSAAIDIHPWHSRVDEPDRPDWAVFDLDPFPPATFDDVRAVARLVRAALDHYGLRGYPKVSGQTGVQIHVPIDRGPSQDEVRAWVEGVARAIGRVDPDRVTWEWEVARRTGKLRIDYTQNIIGKTLAAPYSLRPAAGAPASMPVTWEELDDPAMRPDAWTIETAPLRIREAGDLFAPAIRAGQSLPPLG